MSKPDKDQIDFMDAMSTAKSQFSDFFTGIKDVTFKLDSGLDRSTNGQYDSKTKTVSINPNGRGMQAMLGTILHEANHAQNDTPEATKTYYNPDEYNTNQGGRELSPGRIGSYSYAQSSGLGVLQNQTKKLADHLGLPSVDSEEQPLDEIVSTLRAVQAMQQKGYTGSPYNDAANTMLADPIVKDWVSRNQNPTLPSVNSTPSSSNLMDLLTSLFSKN